MVRTNIALLLTATTGIRDIRLAMAKAVITAPAMVVRGMVDTVHTDTATAATDTVDMVGTVTVAIDQVAMDIVTDRVDIPMGVTDTAGPVTAGRGMPESG